MDPQPRCFAAAMLQVWGGVMPLSFFPVYCGIVLLAAAAVQKLFLVSVRGFVHLRSALGMCMTAKTA